MDLKNVAEQMLQIVRADYGRTTPKLYGQYLQRVGKQKWTRKSKKHHR